MEAILATFLTFRRIRDYRLNAMDDDAYKIKLDVFEGPMDLLIHLIKKNEVDIYDIPIALITDQFLAYLEWIKSMNIDLAGDFLLMAATLTQIKSKMLLPVHDDEEEEEDPRSEITRPLLEYLRMKSAAERLSERILLGTHTFARSPAKEDRLAPSDEREIKVGLFELIDAFQRILDNVSADHKVDMTRENITIKDRMNEIIEILEEKGSLSFYELFFREASKGEVIVTFLAILEMVKLSLVQVLQHVQSGIIRIIYL